MRISADDFFGAAVVNTTGRKKTLRVDLHRKLALWGIFTRVQERQKIRRDADTHSLATIRHYFVIRAAGVKRVDGMGMSRQQLPGVLANGAHRFDRMEASQSAR